MSNIHGLYHQRLDPLPAAEKLGRIHFVGIGGVGMAPLARAALERGLPVSGSDIRRRERFRIASTLSNSPNTPLSKMSG